MQNWYERVLVNMSAIQSVFKRVMTKILEMVFTDVVSCWVWCLAMRNKSLNQIFSVAIKNIMKLNKPLQLKSAKKVLNIKVYLT